MEAVFLHVHIYILTVIPNPASKIHNAEMRATSDMILQFIGFFAVIIRTNRLFETECKVIIFIRKKTQTNRLHIVVRTEQVCVWCSSSDAAPPASTAQRLSFQCPMSRRRWPGEPASCARSSVDTGPGSRTSRKPGHGSRWRAPGSRMW